MVSARAILSTLGAIALAASANGQGVLDNLLNLDLDLGLLQDGALVTADVFADVITEDTCPGSAISVGVVANVLNLVRVCACVSVIQIGLTESVCGDCPANASPICARGRCACQCDEGFVSDSTTGTCVDENACGNSGGSLVSNNDGSFVCFCPSPLLINGQGTCSLPASARARAARRNLVLGGASLPYTSNGYSGKYCPAFETACPLPSGGYECIDTRDSLTSCGGCEGAGGQNCLAIEGALGVRCAATPRGNSECQVSSCFAGYRFENGRCI